MPAEHQEASPFSDMVIKVNRSLSLLSVLFTLYNVKKIPHKTKPFQTSLNGGLERYGEK
jgi:hypothetical protein